MLVFPFTDRRKKGEEMQLFERGMGDRGGGEYAAASTGMRFLFFFLLLLMNDGDGFFFSKVQSGYVKVIIIKKAPKRNSAIKLYTKGKGNL